LLRRRSVADSLGAVDDGLTVARQYGPRSMGQVEARRRFIAAVLLFVVVGLALHFILGLPTWLAIVIPGFALGVMEGVAQRGRG
jgi:hypothetical protein